MKHAREDYNRIQDPEHKIPEDEPVFLIRAHDVTAPDVVRYWAMKAGYCGADKEIIQHAKDQADRMIEWQRHHGMKIPDMPHQPREGT